MPIRPENRARYPADWPAISQAVRVRAGDKCERCGIANHALGCWELGVWRLFAQFDTHRAARAAQHAMDPRYGAIVIVLTVAHLDHVPEHCDLLNLAALCQRCHNRHDAVHRAGTRRQRACAAPKPLLEFAHTSSDAPTARVGDSSDLRASPRAAGKASPPADRGRPPTRDTSH